MVRNAVEVSYEKPFGKWLKNTHQFREPKVLVNCLQLLHKDLRAKKVLSTSFFKVNDVSKIDDIRSRIEAGELRVPFESLRDNTVVALKSYMAFLRDLGEKLSLPEKAVQEKAHPKVVDNRAYLEALGVFPEGMRLDCEDDVARFVDTLNRRFDAGLDGTSERIRQEVLRRIRRLAFIYRDRAYHVPAMLPEALKNAVLSFIQNYFCRNLTLNYNMIYERFEQDFADNGQIISDERMMVAYLKAVRPSYYYNRTFMMVESPSMGIASVSQSGQVP